MTKKAKEIYGKHKQIMEDFYYHYCNNVSHVCQSETLEQCMDCLLSYVLGNYILEERDIHEQY